MKLPRILFLGAALAAASVVHAEQFSIAVFSKTNGWHHDSIPAGVAAIEQLGKLHDFGVFWTEDPTRVFTDQALAKYKAVVFLSTSGDVLTPDQKTAFEKFIRHGGGYVGIHSASDTEYQWEWYTKLVGRMFHIHPTVQSAIVQVEDANFPGMEFYPKRTLTTDEWYEFQPAVSPDLHTLLTVDEKTYNPVAVWENPHKEGKGMGVHPIAWYHNYDGGRAFYTAQGHLSAKYSDSAFIHHLYGGIFWAATGKMSH